MGKKLVKRGSVEVAKKELASLATDVVSSIDKTMLVEKLLEVSKLNKEEAQLICNKPQFIRDVHDKLVSSLVEGAIAARAMEVVHAKLEEGNLDAAKLVLSLNKNLKPKGAENVKELHLHKHQHTELANLGATTTKLLNHEDD